MSGPGELDEDDEALAARCAEMTVEQRGHTALLALWRLRAPLLVLGLDPGWGIHRSALEAAFRGMLLPLHDEPLPDPGPLFTSPPEAEPEGVVAEVQLEVLAELHAWTTAREPGAEEAERVIRLARDLSRSLDRSCEDSLWDHPARHAHARYLAGREALALCEAFSAELVSTLAWRENLGY